MSDVAQALEELRSAVLNLTDEVRQLQRSESFRVRVDRLGLNVKDAARISGLGEHEIRALVRSGRLHSVPCGLRGGKRVIPVSALAEYLDGRSEDEDAA